MKFGVRKPSLKKSIKARTTGRVKRKVKSSVNPLYGKKGMGYIKNPKRGVYNKVYRKTSVGINPLSSMGRKPDNRSTRTLPKNKQAIGYIKKERVEKELIVTNVFEKWLRRLFRKKTIETKRVMEDIVTEQYTYGEIYSIKDEASNALSAYKQCIRYLPDTSNPEVFFPRLKEAECALSKVVTLTKDHSFLIIDDNVVETYHHFINEKDTMIKQFVHTHFSDSLKGADALKTDRGKQNRLLSAYTDLSIHFVDLPESSITMINSVWSTVIPEKKLTHI